MGSDLNKNLNAAGKRFLEYTKGSVNEQSQAKRISNYIRATAEKFGITPEELTDALLTSVFAPGGNVFGDVLGVASLGAEPGDLVAEQIRNKKLEIAAMAASGGSKPAFGNLTSADSSQSSSEPKTPTSNVDTVTQATEVATAAALQDVSSAEDRRDDLIRTGKQQLETTRQNGEDKKAAAGQKVTTAKNNADATKIEGEAEVAEVTRSVEEDNAIARRKYTEALAAVDAARAASQQEISEAQSESDKNNQTAASELDSAKTNKTTTAQIVTSIESKLSDAKLNVEKLSALLNSPDATEADEQAYYDAIKAKKQLEEDLEKAEKDDEQADQAVTKANEKVTTTKQEGEALVKKVTEQGEAKIRKLEEDARKAYENIAKTEAEGREKIKKVKAETASKNKKAQNEILAANLVLTQTTLSVDAAYSAEQSQFRITELKAAQDVAAAKKKAGEVKASGEAAIRQAEGEEQNPTGSVASDFEQSLASSSGLTHQVLSGLNQDDTQSSDVKAINKVETNLKIKDASFNPVLGIHESDVNKAGKKVLAKKQGMPDDLAANGTEETDLRRRNPRQFGV